MPEDPKKKIVTSEIEEELRNKRLVKEANQAYEREKKKEQEEADKLTQQKKLEFQKNLAKKQYTFDKNGDIIELKIPKKGNDHGFDDVVEMNFNTKVQGNIVSPGYDAGGHRAADVVEKEGGYVKIFNKPPDFDRVEFENNVLEAEKDRKKQEQPTFFEEMTLENGVTLKGGPKNQTKTGGPIQIKNRMRIKDFKQASKIRKKQEIAKHAKKKSIGAIDKEFVNKERAEIKQQKYKKTVETWKDEIEKGLVEKGVRFDPELLIKLVMTDSDDNHKSKLDMLKIQPGTELFDQWEKLKEEKKFLDQIKKKFDRVMQDPDKYFDRIVAYNTKPLGIRIKPDRKVELFNEFEKIMNGFNEKIMERQDADWGDGKGEMNSPNAIHDGAATKPIKPEKFESNVRLRKVVGTQNKLEQVNLLNSKVLKNGSAANLRASGVGGNRSKMLDGLTTSKSQMLKSGGLLQPLYKGDRVKTIKVEYLNP